MPDLLPSYYDPVHANYQGAVNQFYAAEIGALIGLSAFAAIGIGTFFTSGTAVAGTAPGAAVVASPTATAFTAGTTITQAQATIMAVLRTGEMTGAGQATLEALVESWGLETFSVEGLIALTAYNSDSAYGSHFFEPGLGGYYGVPHSFPGVGFLPAGPPGSYWGCIGINQGALECTLYF